MVGAEAKLIKEIPNNKIKGLSEINFISWRKKEGGTNHSLKVTKFHFKLGSDSELKHSDFLALS